MINYKYAYIYFHYDKLIKWDKIHKNYFLKKIILMFQYIWIPGDNDIGGEGFEKVSASKLLQFHDTFGHENPVPLNGINFIKVNRLIHEKPQGKWTEKLSNRTNVVISHMPLLLAPGIYSKTVCNLNHNKSIRNQFTYQYKMNIFKIV